MTERTIEGRAWLFGADVDTDAIVPAQYMNKDPSEYAEHVMEPIAPDFADELREGDVVVAGTNFGIGSSREHAAIALERAGVGAIVAPSFGRIFYRNAINQGLPVVRCDERVLDRVEQGDELRVEPFEGVVRNVDADETYEAKPIPEPQRSILRAGGAIEYYTGEES